MSTHQVLLYYHYTTIHDLEFFREEHYALCKALNLLGRVYVATEGINGTVSGTVKETNAYMDALKNHPLFEGIVFKVDPYDKHAFKKLHVRIKKELVNFSVDVELDPRVLSGNYLEPKSFYEALNDPNTVVIDARNDYEYELGHFRGAINPNIETFRDLPKWVQENREKLEGKRILTYCTGGIRCEKFTGWLIKEGFEDVNQLKGGIVT